MIKAKLSRFLWNKIILLLFSHHKNRKLKHCSLVLHDVFFFHSAAVRQLNKQKELTLSRENIWISPIKKTASFWRKNFGHFLVFDIRNYKGNSQSYVIEMERKSSYFHLKLYGHQVSLSVSFCLLSIYIAYPIVLTYIGRFYLIIPDYIFYVYAF